MVHLYSKLDYNLSVIVLIFGEPNLIFTFFLYGMCVEVFGLMLSMGFRH